MPSVVTSVRWHVQPRRLRVAYPVAVRTPRRVSDEVTPADAFGTLGNELRTDVVRTLAEREEPLSFSALHRATDAGTSAGFAYHLRQLTDRYVRETDDGYELTAAGRAVARHLASGRLTDPPELQSVDVDDPCPFCGEVSLALSQASEGAAVTCRSCDRTVSSLPVTPRGLADQDPAGRPAAFDAHHRHRVSLFAAGTCPECGGPVDRDLVFGSTDDPLRARFACETCGHSASCSPTMAVLDHPAVVSLHHRQGEDLRDRPVWNVRGDWREQVVSTDPLIVKVTCGVDGSAVALYLDERVNVVHKERLGDDRPTEAAS